MTSGWRFGPGPFLIAGPCVVEDDATMLRLAETLATLAARHALPVCFKASFERPIVPVATPREVPGWMRACAPSSACARRAAFRS